MPSLDCPFCALDENRIITESDHFIVIRDLYPVTPLHTLLVSKTHLDTFFDLSDDERSELNRVVVEVAESLVSEDGAIEGFNLGANVNEVAGQTVLHFHYHVIPRRLGDIADPRGGIRGVIPDKQKY